MSGLATGRTTPVDIVIMPQRFEVDPDPDVDGHQGVKKTSTVELNGTLGGDLKLGLFIEHNQRAKLKFTNRSAKDSDDSDGFDDITNDPRYDGVIAALERFRPSGANHKWALFAITAMPSGFTSELKLRPKPRRGTYQDVPVIVVHAQAGDDADTVTNAILRGAFGYGVSVVRGPDSDWGVTRPSPEDAKR